MGWTMLYLFVFLKLPIVGGLLHRLVGGPADDGHRRRAADGGGADGPRRPHPRAAPAAPAAPRRSGLRSAPARRRRAIRSVTAAGRARELHQ